ATTIDDDKRRWSSRAEFSADASGTVDSTSGDSLAGTYRGVSPMVLFWSMQLEEAHRDGRAIFSKKDPSPNRVTLDVNVNGRIAASEQFVRNYAAPGTKTRDLKVPGEPGTNVEHTIGRLFIPPPSKFRHPLPVVIVLSGSG